MLTTNLDIHAAAESYQSQTTSETESRCQINLCYSRIHAPENEPPEQLGTARRYT